MCIRDSEKVVLDKAEARIGDPALRPYYRDHVQNMMDVAKQYEAEVLGRNRAAYQGVEGAFAHIAVSYTHLDVYKRQRMPCSAMSASAVWA